MPFMRSLVIAQKLLPGADFAVTRESLRYLVSRNGRNGKMPLNLTADRPGAAYQLMKQPRKKNTQFYRQTMLADLW